jgi:hypothetical protein
MRYLVPAVLFVLSLSTWYGYFYVDRLVDHRAWWYFPTSLILFHIPPLLFILFLMTAVFAAFGPGEGKEM